MAPRRWLVLAGALAAFAVAGPLAAQQAAAVEQEPAGPVAILPEGPIVLDGGSAVVVLANRTTGVVSVTLRGSVARDGGGGYADATLTPVAETQSGTELRRQLSWGQTLAVTVEAPAGTGVLTLESSDASGTPVLRHRELTSTGSVPALPGDSWAGHAGSWLSGFTGQAAGVRVPVLPGTCPESWTLDSVVLADGDAALTGPASCRDDEIVLDLGDAPRAGSYAGSLTVGTQVTAVEVTVSAGWVWAGLLAALGTLLAIGQRAWVVNRRPFAVVAEQARRLTPRAREVDDLVARGGGLPLVAGQPAYRLEPGTKEAMDQLATEADRGRRALGWVRSVLPRPVAEVSEELAVLVAELDQAEQAMTAWAAAGDLFDDLAAAARAHGAQAVVQAGPLWGEVRSALGPTAVQPVRPEAVRPLLESVEAMTALLRLLPSLAALQAGVAARKHSPYSGLDRDSYQEAAQLVRQATEAFDTMGWRQLRASGVDAHLDRARTLLAGLPIRAPEPVLTRGLERAPGTPDVAGDLVLRAGGRWWPRRLLPALPRATVDIVLLFLVAFSVTWGAVALLYAGGAWGSAADAVTAVVTGYGAGALSSPILAGLERLTSRRASLPTEAG